MRLCARRGVWALKAEPMHVGMPDRLLLARGGRVGFMELKAPSGTVDDAQDAIMEDLRDLGFQVGVVRTIQEAEAFLEELLG